MPLTGFKRLLLGVVLTAATTAGAVGQETDTSWGWPAPVYDVRLEKSVEVSMRDGIHLAADLYRPIGATEPLPSILIRTPYNKNFWRTRSPNPQGYPPMPVSYFFAGHGYVVAVVDDRGKYESEGEFLGYAGTDRLDGYDAVTWLTEQSWSNGKIGTYGCSHLGEVQDELAAMRHPNHVAAIPQSGAAYGGAGVTNFGFMRYGALELAATFGWTRGAGSKVYYRPPPGLSRQQFIRSAEYFNPAPVLDAVDNMEILRSLPIIDMMRLAGAPPNNFEEWVSHGPDDPWWEGQGIVTDEDRFNVPALHVNSWYDITPNSTLATFNLYRTNAESERARENQFLIMSPTPHCRSEMATKRTIVGDRDVGDARLNYFELYLEWFDYWLKGIENGIPDRPKVQIYVMGANEWRAEHEWPLARTEFTPYYLHSDGHANSRLGTGTLSTEPPSLEPPDRYTYDPRTPVPTVGGTICCTSAIPPGAVDQSEVEMRGDVLVYTTAVLEQGVEVTGPVELVLYVSSSARDTDFTGKLVDVYPDGTAYHVVEGILRARYREGVDRRIWMDAGEVYEVHVDLESTSNYFGPGHRIRLEVSSSSFPRFDRNLNTGGKLSSMTA